MTVHCGRRYQPSARLLHNALERAGYRGRHIQWGFSVPTSRGLDADIRLRYNANAGRYNKRVALHKMAEAGVPTPELETTVGAIRWMLEERDRPLVGRPDHHRAGQGFHLCHDREDVRRAVRRGATHFLEFIEDAREFRVHVAFDKSIKIAEKVGGGGHIRNSQNGWYFAYPQEFNHKLSLRRVAREAVKSLGLDFGAADVLYSKGKFYVLEVNAAPSLTSRSDTLQRYVKAFMDQ